VSRILAAGDPDSLAAAAAAAGRGELIVVPTDTVYGIAARLDRPAALRAVFEAKARPPGLALPVLVAGLDDAAILGVIDGRAAALAGAFWPGPLTVVVPRSPASPARTAGIGGDGTTVGIRMPAHPTLLRLLADTGPLATTSANRSGQPTPRSVEEIEEVFGNAVAVYLDGGPATGGPPSTVVGLAGPSPSPGPILLRAGAVPFAEVIRILGG